MDADTEALVIAVLALLEFLAGLVDDWRMWRGGGPLWQVKDDRRDEP